MTCIELKSFVTAMMAERGRRHTGDSYHLPLVTTYPQRRHQLYPCSDVTT